VHFRFPVPRSSIPDCVLIHYLVRRPIQKMSRSGVRGQKEKPIPASDFSIQGMSDFYPERLQGRISCREMMLHAVPTY
jgi:hypothetical protein